MRYKQALGLSVKSYTPLHQNYAYATKKKHPAAKLQKRNDESLASHLTLSK